jgi:hypothetical protein
LEEVYNDKMPMELTPPQLDLRKKLFGPLPQAYCSIFYYLARAMLALTSVYVVQFVGQGVQHVAAGRAISMSGKSVGSAVLTLILIVNGIVGYLTQRMFYNMCVGTM